VGTLYIVSTPIGNLKDITLRAIAILGSVDYVLCEDTRVTGKLLKHYDIEKPLVTFTDFNEQDRATKILADLSSSKNVALVSDAGTPLISDPGYKLVREALKRGIRVESIPGPSALVSALVISGLPPDRFIFLGYLPKKDGKRKKLLEDLKPILKTVKSTVIFYESPYRVKKSLNEINSVLGGVEVVVCRELTKVFEEVIRGSISEVLDKLTEKNLKGEFVILF
jgi:16S rRNA (cytidine1402-2'-O)-methyltransferase